MTLQMSLIAFAIALSVVIALPASTEGQEDEGVDAYWDPPLREAPGTFYSAVGPVTNSPAYRVAPSGFGARTDRLYVAAGTRLLAIHSWAPEPAWNTVGGKSYVDMAVQSNGTVSASPVVANFGDFSGSLGDASRGIPPKLPEYFLYVGMSDGRFLVYRDSFNTDQISYDSAVEVRTRPAQFAWSYTVDGAVTSIAVFNPDQAEGRTGRELVAAATDQGKVYLFRVGAAPPPPDRSEIPTTPTDHTFLGVWSAGRPMRVNLADGPMRPQVPMWSPAFSRNGTRFVVGTADGVVHLLNTAGVDTEVWNLTVYPGAVDWRSAPVIAEGPSGPPHHLREIAWAGSRGWLVPRYLNGSLIAGWETRQGRDGYPDGSSEVTTQSGRPDGGLLGQPHPLSGVVYVTSGSGRVFAVRLAGEAPLAGGVLWEFEDTTARCLDPRPTVGLWVDEATSTVLFGAALRSRPGAADMSDGAIYSIGADQGRFGYRITLRGETVTHHPIVARDPEHIWPSVWFVGEGSSESTIYGYSVDGSNAPPDSCFVEEALPLFVGAVGSLLAVTAIVVYLLVRRRRRPKESPPTAPTAPR